MYFYKISLLFFLFNNINESFILNKKSKMCCFTPYFSNNNYAFSSISSRKINNIKLYTYKKNYPLSQKYYDQFIKRLNLKNITNENISNLENNNFLKKFENNIKLIKKYDNDDYNEYNYYNNDNNNDNDNDNDNDNKYYSNNNEKKSLNFEVIKKNNFNFKNIGGYEIIKEELNQCIDILKNYNKYNKYNIRIPKGLILEGPPGTGKTLLAKALAGEANCNFIATSGSDFQEKYVGVGSTRIKELFKLASKNIPCIIFIDEIDSVGRKRSSDGESATSERDSTLNSLLVELDGFKNNNGIFLIAATNRYDLLDSALTRPGRIDKKIYMGLPDSVTRNEIINIHITGKPYDNTIIINNLVDMTEGFTGAQIENLLNEAMLNCLRYNNTMFSFSDFDLVLNKMNVGWQPTEHQFSSDIIDHIAIHEMGHAIVGLLCKHHSKLKKVVINLNSPKSPGYTIFESSINNIYIRESLFEHLMILLGGRIAEEIFYNISVTNGAINDFEEALKLAETMIVYYGMGTNVIYPRNSEKYKELIDNDIINLLNKAYELSTYIILENKDTIKKGFKLLKEKKILDYDEILSLFMINNYELNYF